MGNTLFMNQLGFKPDSLKTFTSTVDGEFEIVDIADGSVVFSGRTSPLESDQASGRAVAKGDFSAWTNPGQYEMKMKHTDQAVRFDIAAQPYNDIKRALLKNFYYQRCGMALEAQYAGAWKHDACHTSDARVYGTNEYRPHRGGWHDAGDYGKYIVPAAKAVADLLLAYEWFPNAFEDKVGIPNDSTLPDLLAEVKYELDFFFLMQREDGAVFHKVTPTHFPALDIMPEDDHGEYIMMPVSLTATATYAATMAMAARVFHAVDEAFAEQCKQAALSAWQWLEQTDLNEGFRNPPDIHTGVYGDDVWVDELYWVNAELFRLTGEKKFLQQVEDKLEEGGFSLCDLGWASVGGYGTLCLLSMDQQLVPPALLNTLREAWEKEANLYTEQSEHDGFGISLLPEDYVWGSNMTVMNRAMQLIIAGTLFNNERYHEVALNHWHYLLGRNVLGYCYVTGFGNKPVNNIHHRPSIADIVSDQVPGMVSGGPNYRIQDETANSILQGQPPAACFIDHIHSFSTNEMTIYWNSPAVFVAAFAEQA